MRTRPWLFAAGALLALAALWLLLQPVAAPPAALAAREGAADYRLDVRNGQVHGPDRLYAWQHEAVRITVSSDRPDAAHLHGYDLHIDLAAHEPGAFDFTAGHSGRFVLELHGDEQQIAVLEVHPRR